MKMKRYKLLLIVLLIVGCDKDSTSSDINPLLGKWQVTDAENWHRELKEWELLQTKKDKNNISRFPI